MPGKPWKNETDRLVHENHDLKEQLAQLRNENALLKLKIGEIESVNHPHISLSSEEEEEPVFIADPQPLPLPGSQQVLLAEPQPHAVFGPQPLLPLAKSQEAAEILLAPIQIGPLAIVPSHAQVPQDYPPPLNGPFLPSLTSFFIPYFIH